MEQTYTYIGKAWELGAEKLRKAQGGSRPTLRRKAKELGRRKARNYGAYLPRKTKRLGSRLT